MHVFRRPALQFWTLILLIVVAFRLWERLGNTALRVTFFDVGQGDGAVIQFPRGPVWMVDSGGGQGLDFGLRVLFPELTRLGLMTVDAALLTHADRDHAEGFLTLFQQLRFREFLRIQDDSKKLARSLDQMAQFQKIPIREPQHRESQTINGVRLTTLIPHVIKGDANDRSVVLRVDYGGCSLLFTGDIGERSETALLEEGISDVTLLKVPHHGSRYSSSGAFLDRVRPRWAVVSAGKSNRYGHPNPLAIERYWKRGIQLLRTDFHGYVRFEISKSGVVHCDSALGNCGRAHCQDNI